MAVPYFPFRGWDDVKTRSEDIIVARCSETPDQPAYKDAVFKVNITVESVLKGTTDLGPATLDSLYRPRQGEHYLVYSTYHDGGYDAVEDYRVIPLGFYFSTNMLAGKSLDEQVHMLLQHRLDDLNRELADGQKEKQRLEEALKR